jgi:dihydrofolate reductase
MKKILVFVSTLDGKITKWGDPEVRRWSSEGDKEYFHKTWHDSKLIVMGSTTYNVEQLKPSAHHLYIVMTSNPPAYKDREVPGRIEFTNESPASLTVRLEKVGYETMLVVGGPQVATSFLQYQLIDEVWLTLEPKIFGMGGNFATGKKLDIDLRLLSCEKINEQGTLLTRYAVVRANC